MLRRDDAWNTKIMKSSGLNGVHMKCSSLSDQGKGYSTSLRPEKQLLYKTSPASII